MPVTRITTWTCLTGHVTKTEQDLGNPADAEQVSRIEQQILSDGCPYRPNKDTDFCRKRCTVERKEYGHDYD